MKVLILDNYDSFTYNLVHLVEMILQERVDVYRNDRIRLEEVAAYDKIILSPGPGLPADAGILLPLISAYASTRSILGVCLGHQGIGEAFGGRLVNLSDVFHGVATDVVLTPSACGKGLFRDLPDQVAVGRYHSWVVSDQGLPAELEVTARDGDGHIMALRHRQYDVQGVQFHPESILTPLGSTILRNWLRGSP